MEADPNQNTHTQSQSLGEGTAVSGHLSSALSTKRSSQFQNETCAGCERLAAELDRVREAAGVDLSNSHADLMAKNREIGRLKALVARQEDDAPEHQQVRELLELWRDEIRGAQRGPKPNISADSTRAVRVRWALKNYGAERTRRAILGCQFDDWAMGRIRKSGGKCFNDLAKHILHDVETFERYEGLYEQNTRPTLDAPPLQVVPKPEKAEKAESGWLGRFAQRGRKIAVGDAPPIDTVLDALSAAGCEWRPGQPDAWSARCPAHEDSSPSLAIHRKPDGMVLLNCFAGCDTEAVLDALNLEWRDLWEHCEDDHQAVNYRSPAERQASIPPHLKQAMRQILARDEQKSEAA